jgi:DNA-binding CsgD family transcriptional regulator
MANPGANTIRKRRTVHHARVKTLSAVITMVCRAPSSLSEPSFVLELERRALHASAKRATGAPLLQRLTATERAVVLVLVEGLSNQEIADRLTKSVDAVKFLLHRVYQKTGVTSRVALVAALRG